MNSKPAAIDHLEVAKAQSTVTLCVSRYGGLWKNLHKTDKVPDNSHKPDIRAEELQALESSQCPDNTQSGT